MTAAAFQATFSDVKLIKGRKCVQLVFEIPLEQSKMALDALGGMPDPSKSVWCAIARLQQGKEVDSSDTGKNPERSLHETPPRAEADNAPRGANKLTQRIAILCGDPVFQQFLVEEFEIEKSKDAATEFVREKCRVASRKDIAGGDAEPIWHDLYGKFQAWKYAPTAGEA